MENIMKLLGLIITIAVLLSCNNTDNNQVQDDSPRQPNFDTIFTVQADMETAPISATNKDDAADDPAIWLHPTDPAKSIIYGSNKKGGISAYSLDGKEVSFYSTGRINNVDVIYNFQHKGNKIDLFGATNRTLNSVDIYLINQSNGALTNILNNTVKATVDEVYGFCFYRSKKTAKYYAIVCGKNGKVEQYEILSNGDGLDLKLIRELKFDTQTEGMVADHVNGILYVGEEDKGIWKVSAEPDNSDKTLLNHSEQSTNKNIRYDVEGLTIYYASENDGYLIASSQGNNSFAIYDRKVNNGYIASFKIIDGAYDSTEDTDGIDVLNFSFGSAFPDGIFVVQDGSNKTGDKIEAQNFKYVRWSKIAALIQPPLRVEAKFNIRDIMK